MADLKASVVLNLVGNLDRRAREFSRSIGQMSSQGQRHLGRLNRSFQLLGKGIDRLGNRYTALATGAAGVGTLRYLATLERRFTRLGIQSNKTASQMEALKKEIFDIARAKDIQSDPAEITAAIEAIVEKTGDLDFAAQNIRNIGLAIQATGAEGRAIGEILAEFQKMKIRNPDEILRAIDTLNVQGKEGAFTLENLAALGPRVITAYSSSVKGARSGTEVLREMGAALQAIRMGTGSSEQAATAFEALLRSLSDPQKLKQLKKLKIQVFDPDEMKKGNEVLRPINQLMLEILEKTKGRKTILGQVFDAEAVRAFNALSPEDMARFMAATGDGTTTMNDSARAAKDFAGAMQALSTSWKKFADGNLTKHIQSLATWLNSLEPGTVDRWLKIGGGLALIGAAAVVGKKAWGAGRSIKNGIGHVLNGGAGGAAGAGSGMPAGVTPVYVVNFPGAALPGSTPPGGHRGGGGRILGGLQRAGMVAGAGAAGYAVGSAVYNNALAGNTVGDKIGAAVARSLAFLRLPGAREAVANMERYEGTIKLQIDDQRTRVSGMRSSRGLDLEVDSGRMGVGY